MTILWRVAAIFSTRARLRLSLRLLERGAHAKGFRHLARAGRRQCLDAHYHLGRCYLAGRAVPRSRTEAIRWLERAAQGGHAQAQFLVAALHVQGVGSATEESSSVGRLLANTEHGTADYAAALAWARRAAEQGVPDAQALLGYILTSGPEPLRDLEQAERWYRCSAAAGCARGSLGLGMALLRKAGDEVSLREAASEIRKAAAADLDAAIYLLGTLTELVERDLAGAALLYRRVAESGLREGQRCWGLALLHGRGVERDSAAAESWLRRAARAGDAEAAAVVGHLYAHGGERRPNYAEAAIWLQRASELGHAAAARMLGQLHAVGAMGAPDPAAATEWLQRAASMGDRPAQAELGNLVLSGSAVSDLLKVGEWFERGANAGDPVAAFNLAVCLAEGFGVDRDERKAAEWIARAAENLPIAQYWYGRMLTEGRGLEPDLAAARVWLGRAAEGGIVEAQVMLGELILNARGGPRDQVAAADLFAKAAAQGHAGAMFALGALADRNRDGADRACAAQWFRQAAERGHPYAQLMLARYLAHGLAGSTDLQEAQRLLEAAQAAGVTQARLELERLSISEAAPLLTATAA
jgi:TPR repeat protein